MVKPSLENELTAAVKPSTACAASRPESLANTIESLSLIITSLAGKPWRLNSRAASDTALKELPVSLATSKISFLNLFSSVLEFCKTLFISASDFSTSIVVVIKDLKPCTTELRTPTEAPNANTRALAASIDLVNSSACPVILPKGCDKAFMLFAFVPKFILKLLPAFLAAA